MPAISFYLLTDTPCLQGSSLPPKNTVGMGSAEKALAFLSCEMVVGKAPAVLEGRSRGNKS